MNVSTCRVALVAILKNPSCLWSVGKRSRLAASTANRKFSCSEALPHKLHSAFFKRVTETKLLVQLNQWNDLTELRVFLGISNPFLRGTVLLKGSSRLWQMRTATMSQLSITGREAEAEGRIITDRQWPDHPPLSPSLAVSLFLCPTMYFDGVDVRTFKIYKGSCRMPSIHLTAEDDTPCHISAFLCVLKTWAGQNSQKRADVYDTWSLLFKLYGGFKSFWPTGGRLVMCGASRDLLGMKAHAEGAAECDANNLAAQ